VTSQNCYQTYREYVNSNTDSISYYSFIYINWLKLLSITFSINQNLSVKVNSFSFFISWHQRWFKRPLAQRLSCYQPIGLAWQVDHLFPFEVGWQLRDMSWLPSSLFLEMIQFEQVLGQHQHHCELESSFLIFPSWVRWFYLLWLLIQVHLVHWFEREMERHESCCELGPSFLTLPSFQH